MENLSLFIVVVLVSVGCSMSLEKRENNSEIQVQLSMQKRFVNPLFSLGAAENGGLVKIRTKRSEECEKLRLCKLHARANRSFMAAFQLYFVNKENARLWDHQAHSIADCENRYGGCYRK